MKITNYICKNIEKRGGFYQFFLLIVLAFMILPIKASASILAKDTFHHSANGYSKDDGDPEALKIKGNGSSYKIYSLDQANMPVTVSFKLKRRNGKWESNDCISVKLNDVEKLNKCKNDLPTSYRGYSFDARTDANGNLKVEFINSANKYNEWIKIDDVTISSNDSREGVNDLCYDSISYSGTCIDFGPFKGGVNCKQTIDIRSLSNDTLAAVTAVIDKSGISGDLFSDCGVDGKSGDGTTCEQFNEYDFGPFGMFNKGVRFDLDDLEKDEEHSIYTVSLLNISMFSGDNLYAEYIKKGTTYKARLKKCPPSENDETCSAPTGVGEGSWRDFCIRFKANVMGDMVSIGNTLTVAPKNDANSADCNTYTNGSYIDPILTNNSEKRYCHYNVDGEQGSAATRAELLLPPGSKIVWAGLYWQALSDPIDPDNFSIDIRKDGESYHTVSADRIDYQNDYSKHTVKTGSSSGRGKYADIYSAFADVTDLFQNEGWLDGNYTIRTTDVMEGRETWFGIFSAWNLIVVYKNNSSLLKNITIFDGWKQVSNDVGHKDVQVDVSGFYTPRRTPINASVAVFAAEGDYNIDGDKLKARDQNGALVEFLNNNNPSLSNQTFSSLVQTAGSREPQERNNNGIDIQQLDMGDIMAPEQTSMEFHFTSTKDLYFPSVIAFSTDLFQPKFCYDYSYKQASRVFTEDLNVSGESFEPYIHGNLIPGIPIDISLYIKNMEFSDILAKNLSIDIVDINTSQATYRRDSTYITPPGAIAKIHHDDINVSDSYDANITIGDIDSQQYFYIYYSLDPQSGMSTIDMPMRAIVHYTLEANIGGQAVTLDDYSTPLSKMDPCIKQPVPYQPAYGTFNVVQKDIYTNVGANYYNIPTQVAGRNENFRVVSYDESAVTSEKAVSTVVGVEVIDMGAFHDINASCYEPTNTISPRRKWIVIGGDSNMTFADFNISDIMPKSRKNAAFRIVLNLTNDGTDSLIQIGAGSQKPYVITNFSKLVQDIQDCTKPVPKPTGEGNTSDVLVACSNADNTGVTKAALDRCMECLYGYNIKRICSRDNFSIRPESFFIGLDDNNRTNNPIPTRIADNNGASMPSVNLASGYRYKLDINATKFNALEAAEGYTRLFFQNMTDHNASLIWSPPNATYNTTCNKTDTSSINNNFILYKGVNQNVFFSSTDIGIYRLNMIDRGWTLVDQNPPHHNTGHYASHFINWDCVQESNIVQDEFASIGISGGQLQNINGCDINTFNYTGPSQSFNDLNLTFIPYRFDIDIARSINTGYSTIFTNAWVYDSNISDDMGKEEAFHITGTIQATGYDGNISTNFVDGCYAKPISLYLDHNFTNMPTAFQYRLIDTNGSVLDDQFGDINSTTKFAFLNTGDFTKNQSGSTQIQLHLNFKRSNNIARQPRIVSFNDFNATCFNLTECDKYADGVNNHATKGCDHNVTPVIYYYGRLHAPDYRTDQKSIMTPIYVEVYCDPAVTNCGNFNITEEWKESVDDINWWINPNHTNSDGNITEMNATVAQMLDNDVDINGANPNFNVHTFTPTINYNGTTLPHKTRIFVTPSNWLNYHRFFPDGRIYYSITFEGGASDWGGIGKLGKTVDTNASKNTTRRIEW